MAKRYFNWKLAIVILLGFVVVGATAVGLRKWQRSRRAENALPAGLEAYKQQRWEDAASNLGRYLGVNRGDVNVLLKYAEAQLNIRPSKPNMVQQAIAAYREVLRIDKSNAEAAKRLSEIYLAIGSPGEAELIAKRQLETDKDPELRRLLALSLAAQRKFSEAGAELKKIIAEHPDQILAYETLGRLTQQRPEDFPDPAANWFNQAVDKNPSSALAHIIRASFLSQSGKDAEAKADLEQAEKLDVTDPNVSLRLAMEYINAGVLDKAERHLAAVQGVKPKNAALWQTWAQLALKSQSQAKMVEVAEAGLKEFSSQPWDFLPIAAELFIRGGQPDRATECLSKLREKDLLPETVAFFEGLIAEQKGDMYGAVKSWRRSVELGNRSAQIRLALSTGLSRLGDMQSALRELRRLVTEMPNFFAGRMALVRLLARAGNWTEVAEQARRASQLSPQNLEAALYYLRAQMYLLAMQPTAPTAEMWQDIEKQLASLEKAAEGAADVKLLQFQLAMQQNNLSRAQDLLTQLKKEPPATANLALAEAELLVAQEKTNEAISILKQAIKDSPDALEPVTYLTILLNRQNNLEECQAVIKDALARIAQPATQRELGLLLAQLYTQWQKQDKAYELLQMLVAKLPGDIPLKRRLLACEQVLKDSARAQQIVDNIKALEGQDGWQWRYEQARLWFAGADFKQRYTQITSLLQENLLSNPEDQASRAFLAAAYERAGELRLAISTYQEALNRSPDDLRVIIPYVAALSRAGEDAQADEILRRASQQKLQHPSLAVLQLQSHLRRGELASASDILEDLLKNDPNNRAICLTLAGLKMQQNQLAEAEQLLDRLKVQEPNSLDVTSAQVRLKIRQSKPQEAIKLCDEIVNRLNNAPAYILRARTYAELGDPNKAAKDLEHAGTIEPKNVGVWIAKSDFYRSQGQADKTTDCLLQALSIDPNSLAAQKRAIPLFLASGNRDRSQQGKTILDKALQTNPDDVDLRLFKANSLLGEGTAPAIASARQILQKITEEQPEITGAWALLGEIALSQREPTKAFDAAMAGLIRRPNDKGLLLLKANAEAARSPILSIPTLENLHKLDPNDVDVAVRLARTYIAANQPARGVELLRKQLASSKDPAQSRRYNIALAVALYKSGDKNEAGKQFDSLYKSDPNDPGALLADVSLLIDEHLWDQLNGKVATWCQGHPKDTFTPLGIAQALMAAEESRAHEVAEGMFRTVLRNNPDHPGVMTGLAILLYTTGRPAEAAELNQQILKIQPDNLIVMNNLAWTLCEEQGKYQEALELAERGLKIAPQYIDLIDTRGVVYYRLGQYEKAIADFTKCLELYLDTAPSKVASRFHLARAFVRSGQSAKAVEQLNQALELHKQIGGLSPADLAEAQRLQEQVQKGK